MYPSLPSSMHHIHIANDAIFCQRKRDESEEELGKSRQKTLLALASSVLLCVLVCIINMNMS